MHRSRIAALIALAGLSSGCFSTLPLDATDSHRPDAAQHSLGSVSLHSERLGQATIAPTACQAGDRAFFLGGDFIDEHAGLDVRFVLDPLEGPALRIFARDAPVEKSTVFHRGDCHVMKYSFTPTNWRINDVFDYRISVAFECAKAGDAASGELSAAHCH